VNDLKKVTRLYQKGLVEYQPCNFVAVKSGRGKQLAMIKEKVEGGYTAFKWRDNSRTWTPPVKVKLTDILGFMKLVPPGVSRRAGKSIRDYAIKEKKNGR